MVTEYVLLGSDRLPGAACRWRARHGVRRDLDQRAARVRHGARAGQRHRAHRRDLHHGRFCCPAYLASQCRLAAGDAPRDRGCARSDRSAPGSCRTSMRASCGRSWRPISSCSASSFCSRRGSLRPRATRRARGSGRSDLSRASSMPAAAAAGGRSRPQALSAPGTHHARLSARSTPPSSSSPSRPPPPSSSNWRLAGKELLALIVGGMLAAPLGGWAVKHVPARPLMIAVGCLVIALSLWQIARAFKFV